MGKKQAPNVFMPKPQKSVIVEIPNLTLGTVEQYEVQGRIQQILALGDDWTITLCAVYTGNAKAALAAFNNKDIKGDARRRAFNALSYTKDITIARALHEELAARGIAHDWKGE